ncbi:MAG: hypothetical protein Q8936_15325 [Bacillota bacterium]|nr:hypothetical protein [Bacillota bacterium]
MKRIAALVTSTVMLLSLAGCSNYTGNGATGNRFGATDRNYTTRNNMTSTLRDGTYIGEGDKTRVGYRPVATVVVSGGKITGVTLRALDASGKEINYSTASGTAGGTTTGTNIIGSPNTTTGNNTTSGNLNTGMTGNNMGTTNYTGTTTYSGTTGTSGNTGVTGTSDNVIRNNPSGGATVGNAATGGGSTGGGTTGGTPGSYPQGGAGYTGSNYGTGTANAITGTTGTTTGTSKTTTNATTGTTTGGTTGGAISRDVNSVRNQLANLIVQKQTPNVTIASSDPELVGGWRQAVSRALDKAK